MANRRYLPLSLPRRWVGDLIELSRHIPLVPFERKMNLADLAAVRKTAGISWCALFIKAMALVSQRRPELRRSFLRWPWPRLFENNVSIASVAIERDWQGEPGVFFAPIENPENRPLTEIEASLRQFKNAPIEEIRPYRKLFRVSRFPRFVRRWLWYGAHTIWGSVRMKYFGTFGISVTASEGASALALISPTSTTLHYGVLEANGDIEVRMTFDHRAIDGAPIARALRELEETLHGDVLSELHSIQRGIASQSKT